ncbi:Cyclic AMP response element-binding protein A [Trichostrongylus colubriformis]|uniref:Cyclic AMP response element-binding protein A n=1 Tax=Trichostrongylus colubriformis TaxID=6319 RepID=A0AAN8J3D7_TRICO
MEDEWAPLLNKDCMLFSPNGFSLEDDFHLTSLDYNPSDKVIKKEPIDETSDYHGSTSGSPSSSLSSPDMKDNLGVDLSFMQFANNVHPFLHSPASSDGSPFGHMMSSGTITQQHSPLPPVSHFSHQMSPHQERDQRNQHHHPHQQTLSSLSIHHVEGSMTPFSGPETVTFFDALGDRTPSPPTSERSSPAGGMVINNVVYGTCNPSHFGSSNGIINSLSAAQQQLKSRSKMHEMAVRQRLITDQDPRSQGLVQLSSEEKRTLLQEGYPVPTRLPLSKAEEESLKIVRRKIKNKLSAQESRRKRKEYMDTLESRCQAYFNENSQLKNRVRQLEANNQNLTRQVKKLQEMVESGAPHSDLP